MIENALTTRNKGNFLNLMKIFYQKNPIVNIILKGKDKMLFPKINNKVRLFTLTILIQLNMQVIF